MKRLLSQAICLAALRVAPRELSQVYPGLYCQREVSYNSILEQFAAAREEEYDVWSRGRDLMIHEILIRLFAHAALYRMALGREYGLNPFQLLSILLIGGNQTGVSIKVLREAMVIPGSSLTFTLDSLEKKGLIRRSRSRADRRQWLLFLTEKGQKFYSSLIEREAEAVMSSIEKYSEEERAAFFKIAEEISQSGALQAL